MLAPSWTTVRLFVHVLAATVWVGGQFTLAGLVPALRAAGPDVPKLAARAFNRVAWPAYGLLWLTGIWNLLVLPSGLSTDYMVTLFVKILVVLASGITAFLHARALSKAALAVFGAFTAVTALAALFLGILLHG
jgi:putative copper export protein